MESSAQLPLRISARISPESVIVPPSFVTTSPAGVGLPLRA